MCRSRTSSPQSRQRQPESRSSPATVSQRCFPKTRQRTNVKGFHVCLDDISGRNVLRPARIHVTSPSLDRQSSRLGTRSRPEPVPLQLVGVVAARRQPAGAGEHRFGKGAVGRHRRSGDPMRSPKGRAASRTPRRRNATRPRKQATDRQLSALAAHSATLIRGIHVPCVGSDEP
jgi:hypothetical protein